MNVKRGEIWLADLDPIQGSEQAGIRPVLILQNNHINRFTTTILAIPLTTNVQRAALPTAVLIAQGEGNLMKDSVALCHQMRALDVTRLRRRFGLVSDAVIVKIETRLLYALGIKLTP
ncbi:MAG: type II toxin-antitoxin system PemK/MazF family toxin [Acidobacteria bacterium]|nr:type II toxin-antitoxin system PemK/MazF family toxin [Acidobacteriota bacterium]MBI3424182.1 type II toxin-antitoxin system PemK/MazF family toxin [Acidobacteriota bacterium]